MKGEAFRLKKNLILKEFDLKEFDLKEFDLKEFDLKEFDLKEFDLKAFIDRRAGDGWIRPCASTCCRNLRMVYVAAELRPFFWNA
jgi:hypothetical protein